MATGPTFTSHAKAREGRSSKCCSLIVFFKFPKSFVPRAMLDTWTGRALIFPMIMSYTEGRNIAKRKQKEGHMYYHWQICVNQRGLVSTEWSGLGKEFVSMEGNYVGQCYSLDKHALKWHMLSPWEEKGEWKRRVWLVDILQYICSGFPWCVSSLNEFFTRDFFTLFLQEYTWKKEMKRKLGATHTLRHYA